MEHITSKPILQHLRLACSPYGSSCLGFEPHEVGTHSLQSGAAMEMYLGEIPVYTLMLIGRWLSDAFLCYIHNHAEQFSCNNSKKMLTFWSFHHIPDIAPRQISSEDPRQRNHRNNAEMRRNIGGDNWLSPFTPNQRTRRRNTINGGASISAKGIGEGLPKVRRGEY